MVVPLILTDIPRFHFFQFQVLYPFRRKELLTCRIEISGSSKRLDIKFWPFTKQQTWYHHYHAHSVRAARNYTSTRTVKKRHIKLPSVRGKSDENAINLLRKRIIKARTDTTRSANLRGLCTSAREPWLIFGISVAATWRRYETLSRGHREKQRIRVVNIVGQWYLGSSGYNSKTISKCRMEVVVVHRSTPALLSHSSFAADKLSTKADTTLFKFCTCLSAFCDSSALLGGTL